MSAEPTIIRSSDLPKEFEFNSNPAIFTILMVVGIIILAIGVLSLIFAPSKLEYYGSLSFFQMVYMSPGPVASIGALIIGVSSHMPSALINAKAKKITEAYQLDPNEDLPEGSFLLAVPEGNKLSLVLAVESTEEKLVEETN